MLIIDWYLFETFNIKKYTRADRRVFGTIFVLINVTQVILFDSYYNICYYWFKINNTIF